MPEQETTSDWSQGALLSYVRELTQYWAKDYDHQRLANRLNAYPNFKTEVMGLTFISAREVVTLGPPPAAHPRLAWLHR